MKKVCIVFDTGDGRRGGHFTEYAFCGLPGVEIAALADRNRDSENAFRRSGAHHRYYDWEEMLEAEKPDFAVFCSRLPEEHCRQIRFAIDRGIHVLCEKPLAADLEQADDLVRRAERAGVLIQVAHLARFAPVFQEMKRLIDAGAIGRPLTCYMRGKEDQRGGGEDMMVLGTHLFDLSVMLFGLPESVWAEVRQEGFPIRRGSSIEVTEPVGLCAGDDIFARFRYANGVNGIFESRRGMLKDSRPDRFGIVAAGTKGTLAMRYNGERSLRLCENFPVPMEDEAAFRELSLPPPAPIPGAAALDYAAYGMDKDNASHRYFGDNNRRAAWNLLCAANGQEALKSSAKDALNALEMIEGVYASSISGKTIELPLADRTHPLAADGK